MISLLILVVLVLVLGSLWRKRPAVQHRVQKREDHAAAVLQRKHDENEQIAQGYSWIIAQQDRHLAEKASAARNN